jgi:glycosyltransferase involved in cell wall biosynthesis
MGTLVRPAEAGTVPAVRAEGPTTLHVISSPQRRGAEQVAWTLAERLETLGVPSPVVALAASQLPETDLPVPSLAGRRGGTAGLVAALARRARKADVIVSHGGTTLVPSVLAGAASRRPVLYRNIGDPAYWAPTGVRRTALAAALRRASGIVALYPRAAAWMAESYRIRPERIAVVASPVDGGRFPLIDQGTRLEARAALGIADDGPVLAFVGALSPEKRPDLALQIAAALPEVRLLVAGDGPLRDEVAHAAHELGDRVRLLGQLSDVRPVYAAADAVVITSDTEGVPGVLLESVLSGTPVVGSAVGAIPDLLTEALGRAVRNDLPLLVEACAEAVRRPKVPSAARSEVAAAHSLDHVAAQWAELLRRAHRRQPIGPTRSQ